MKFYATSIGLQITVVRVYRHQPEDRHPAMFRPIQPNRESRQLGLCDCFGAVSGQGSEGHKSNPRFEAVGSLGARCSTLDTVTTQRCWIIVPKSRPEKPRLCDTPPPPFRHKVVRVYGNKMLTSNQFWQKMRIEFNRACLYSFVRGKRSLVSL